MYDRDQIAMAAMSALIIKGEIRQDCIPARAYDIADMMIRERTRREEAAAARRGPPPPRPKSVPET